MEDPGLKLEKESNSLALLREKLGKSSSLSEGMCSILTSFDEHLMKLEETILPVYLETGNLQRRQENVEKIIERLDYVIQYYKVPKEVEATIRDGPSGCLDSYLECLQKIKSSIDFFTKNTGECPELYELNALFDQGGDSLQIEFRNLLRHSKPVPPIEILDMLGLDEEMPRNETKIEHLPAKILQDLFKISSWLLSHGNEDFVNVYSSIRSNILSRSIQNLKDHLKNTSGNSNTLNVQNSPQLGTRRSVAKETTPRRPPKSIQQMFVRKATAVIAKYSPTVESAVLGHRFQTSLLPEPKDEIPETEVMAFMTSVSGLLKLMQSELNLMNGIIPNKFKKAVFEKVVMQAMENLVSEGDLIVSRVKKNVSKHEFSAALNLFPILRHLMTIKTDFEKLFQGCSSSLYDKLQGFIITVQATISKTLEEFIESVKNDPDTKMPKDGTVHQLTSNAIMLLEQLQDFQDILSSVLILQDTSNALSKDKGKLAFAQYITRVLAALVSTLTNKSENYNDAYLRAIFRMNNLHYILKALQRTGLREIVIMHNPNIENNYNDQIRDQKRVYSQSWSRVLHYVMEVDKPISQQRASLNTSQVPANMKNIGKFMFRKKISKDGEPVFTFSDQYSYMPLKSEIESASEDELRDKDRQNIKDKFTGFNKEMDEITKSQKAYAVPDVELRESLKRDNKEFILPKYTMFYEKYIDSGFTKNVDKYIKYTPADISNVIDTFFDAAA